MHGANMKTVDAKQAKACYAYGALLNIL